MLPDDELQELAEDIARNGLLMPIVRDTEGVLLEGRNRLKACELAKVEPTFETYDGDDPAAYILAVNLQRRHLTKGQRAMVAAKAVRISGDRVAKSAETADTSKRRVEQALTVLDHAPDLAEAVLTGTRSLDDAYAEARKAKADLDSDERKLERLRESARDLADAVEESRLGLNEALAAAAERERKQDEERRDARELLRRILDLVGQPSSTELAAFTGAWATRLGDVDGDLPQRTVRAGHVLLDLAERMGG